jgi:2-amino-4-hydroxy-6-hydroxymethyldihydropteridine diphosphokinase
VISLDHHAIIAIGANLGDPIATVRGAFAWLQRVSTRPVMTSSLWRSDPVDCPPGSPPFINAVAAVVPVETLTPESLLEMLQEREREAGRRPKQVLNEARPLDLDLIAFRWETRASPALTLPHPRAHERRFVLAPLAEIAPDLRLPGQLRTVQRLLEALPSSGPSRVTPLPVR